MSRQAPNFNRLARPYRWMEYFSFGPFLMRCRLQFLHAMDYRRRALILGDGDGRFTARLLRSNPSVNVLALDASCDMLQSLKLKAKDHSARLHTQCVDIRALRLRDVAGYDLIVSHFFLDCLSTEDIARLADQLKPSVVPDGIWVVSEFSIPSNPFGRTVASALIGFLYLSFHLLTGLNQRRLPDYRSALLQSGWRLQTERLQLGGLLVSQIWQLP